MKKMKMCFPREKRFVDGFKEYILDCKARNLWEGTINHYRESIKQIYKRISPDTPISSLNQRTMKDFYIALRDDPNLNEVSMGTYARDLKTLMRFFMKCGYIPHFEIQLPKADKAPIQTYTDDELKKLLKKPDVRKCIFSTYRSWVIVNFLLSTGVRQNSLVNIKIRDVDFDNSVVYVNTTKNRKPLIIPLNEDIVKILKEYLQYRGGGAEDWLFCSVYGKQLTRSSCYHAIWDYCHERGLEQTGVHRFRHTFAKKWATMGGSVATLQKILGHSSLAITENYLNILTSDLKKDIDRVNIIRSLKQERVSMKAYDNTENPIDLETTVVFDSAPIVADSLTVSGTLTIRSSNENCAVVSGVGILTGIPYTHTTHVVSRSNVISTDGKSISVSDATLVNAVNSNAVADRLYAYYTSKRDMQIPIVLSGQRCGMRYSCTTPLGEKKEAFIASMAINASAIAKADCKMVSGYEPSERPGEFTHLVVLTGSGVFKVPQDVLDSDNPRIRLVLIGGGQGGQGGENGEAGKVGCVKSIDQLAKPGRNGENGSPGKIIHIQIDKKNLKDSYQYSCGTGGAGSYDHVYGSTPYDGDVGGATIFGEYSSENGIIPTSGFLEPLSGAIYGGPSPDFSKIIKAGRGGGTYWDNGVVWSAKPEPGICVLNEETARMYGYEAGVPIELPGGIGPELESELFTSPYSAYSGGGSGGPCLTQSEPGEYHWWDGKKSTVSGNTATLGKGGDGYGASRMPSPFLFSETAYGQGGLGGQGGPGGGSSGMWTFKVTGFTINDGTPGDNGRGAYGGAGTPGCILVYY